MTPRRGGLTATGLVLIGLACQEVGAALAYVLFPHTGPLGMVMLRLVFSAALLLAIARPRWRGHARVAWTAAIRLGLALAVMNSCYYLALERLPLGITVTIEVLGPLVLSIVVARRRSALVWAALAFGGVLALGGGGWDRLDPLGVLFALGAAASWAGYILAAARVGEEFQRLDGLAFAMLAGALLSLPLGLLTAGSGLWQPRILALAAGVALLSSAIPYALELVALRRISSSAFAILMSLAPATACLAGFLLLGQHLTWLEGIGVALIVIACAGAVRAMGERSASIDADPLAPR